VSNDTYVYFASNVYTYFFLNTLPQLAFNPETATVHVSEKVTDTLLSS